MGDLKVTREYFVEESVLGEVQKFEEKYSRQLGMPLTISDFGLDTVVKKVETVGFSDELITAKVYDSVIRGADDDETLLAKLARVVEMDSEQQTVSIITPDDFKIYPGGTGLVRSGGGVFDRIKLDCSTGKGIYKTDIGFEKWWIKSNKYSGLEEALWAAGNAIYKDIVTKVIVDLEADKHATMTNSYANWGNNHYKSLIMMDSLIEAEGMKPDFVVINPTELYDILTTDVFINQDYARVAMASPPRDGSLIASLFGRIPIYCHRAATTTIMTMGCRLKSALVGFYQPLAIENYNDPREGMEGSVLSVQYDYKNGSNAELTKGTQKSWAIGTGH